MIRRVAWLAFLGMILLPTVSRAAVQIAISGAATQNPNGTWNQGSVSLTVSGLTKSVRYGQFSNSASIAAGIAAAFSMDCDSPVVAKSNSSGQIEFLSRNSAAIGAISYSVSPDPGSDVATFQVGIPLPAPVTLALACAQTSLQMGQTLSCSTTSSPVVQGSVSFLLDGVVVSITPIASNGTNSFTYPLTTVGTGIHTVSADLIESPNALVASAPPILLTVSSTAALPAAIEIGALASSIGVPSLLSIRIYKPSDLNRLPLPAGGQATCDTPWLKHQLVSITQGLGSLPFVPLAAGNYVFTCTYLGDQNYLGGAVGTRSGSFSNTIFRREITIDHTKVSNSDLTDFPVLVTASGTYLMSVPGGGKLQSGGLDIIFSSDPDGQNILDFEIDSYQGYEVAAWVRIPTLSHTQDTNIYMWYGIPGITSSQQNPLGVWKNGYAGVYHLGQDDIGSVTYAATDSTNPNELAEVINYSSQASTGIIGDSLRLVSGTSSPSYLRIPSSPTDKPTSGLTLEAWVNPTSLGNMNKIFGLDYSATGVLNPPYFAYSLGADQESGRVVFGVAGSGSQYSVSTTSSLPLNAWSFVAGSYDGSNEAVYFNGNPEANMQDSLPIDYGTSQDLAIGAASPYTPQVSQNWLGSIDEARISSTPRSADWIKTEYNNVSSPSTFITVGPEVTAISAPALKGVTSQCGLYSDAQGDYGVYGYDPSAICPLTVGVVIKGTEGYNAEYGGWLTGELNVSIAGKPNVGVGYGQNSTAALLAEQLATTFNSQYPSIIAIASANGVITFGLPSQPEYTYFYNYIYTTQEGYNGQPPQFSITPLAIPTLSWGLPSQLQFGVPLSAALLSATSSAPGTITYNHVPGELLAPGTQVFVATFTPTDPTLYSPSTMSKSIMVSGGNGNNGVITWLPPQPISYGTPLNGVQLNASSIIPGTFTYSPPAGTLLAAGENTLSTTFIPSDLTNYTPISSSLQLLVKKANPTVVWAPTNLQGNLPVGPGQLNATSSVPGSFEYTPYAGTYLHFGEQSLNTQFTPSDDIDYNPISVGRSITVSEVPRNLIFTYLSLRGFNTDRNGYAYVEGDQIYKIDTLTGYAIPYAALVGQVYSNPNAEPLFAISSKGQIAFIGGANGGTSIDLYDPATHATSIIAGSPVSYGYSGDGGPATSALFEAMEGLYFDSSDNLYVVCTSDSVVRRIDASSGLVTTIAGTPKQAGFSGDGNIATSALLSKPSDMVIDEAGNIYIADSGNGRIRKVDHVSGVISTFLSGLATPRGIAIDNSNNLDVATGPSVMSYPLQGGSGTLIAGDGQFSPPPGNFPLHPYDGIPATNSTLTNASGVRVDGVGDYYIFDDGVVKVVGYGPSGLNARLPIDVIWPSPASIPYGTPLGSGQLNATVDASGGGYATITYSPPAGTVLAPGPQTLTALATPSSINLFYPTQVAVELDVVATPSFTGLRYAGSPYSSGSSGDGSLAEDATFNSPMGIAFDANGNLYIADTANCRIREINGSTGIITTVVGLQSQAPEDLARGGVVCGTSADGTPATEAALNNPTAIAFDGAGNLYISDSGNSVVRKVDVNTKTIRTVAGNGTASYSSDGVSATATALNYPMGLALDSSGNLYIADRNNHRVRYVAESSGIITTIAGTGSPGFAAAIGPANTAQLNLPSGVLLDPSGNLYIADSGNNAIRVVTPGGSISTVVGSGTAGYAGDGSSASGALLSYPDAIVMDSMSNLYIADSDNHVIRRVDGSSKVISTIIGNGLAGAYESNSGIEMNTPSGLSIKSDGNLYIADEVTNEIISTYIQYLPAPQITWNPANPFYLSNLNESVLNATASIPGSFVYDPPIGTPTSIGSVNLNTTFYPEDSFTYSPVSASRTINVATYAGATQSCWGVCPTITWAPPPPIIYGTPVSASDYNIATSSDVEITMSPAIGTILNVGEHYLSAHVAQTSNPLNYYTNATQLLSVQKSPITVLLSTSNAFPSKGEPVMLSASATGIVDGTAQFYDGANLIGTARIISGSTSFVSPPLAPGTHSIVAKVLGNPNYLDGQSNALIVFSGSAKAADILWPNPRSITYGTALSSTQLNAEVAIPGSLTYFPAIGTVLPAGLNTLSVIFTPDDRGLLQEFASVPITVTSSTIDATPKIEAVSPSPAQIGSLLTISGKNFGDSGTVSFRGISTPARQWQSDSVQVVVPAGTTTGDVVITSQGVSSNGYLLLILGACNVQ